MAGPAKKRANAEKQSSGSSDTQQSGGGRESSQRSTPKSIPRLDGNRDPAAGQAGRGVLDYTKPTSLKNISEFLGYAGWAVACGQSIPNTLPQRPSKLNTNGREAVLTLNTFNVINNLASIVYQYDVAWGATTDPTKRVLIKKIWNSKAVKDALGEPNNKWIYDGNKLAWSSVRLERDETRIQVDLDQEEGRARPSDKNKHMIFIRMTRKVDFSGLSAFLNGQAAWSPECIDTINFMDHVLREGPARKYTQIKKSFFQRGEQRFDLGGGVEAFKGVFSSLRVVLQQDLKKGLSLNVDVANGTFWRAQELTRAVAQVFNCQPAQFQQRFREAQKDWRKSVLRKDLAKFKRVGVTATHNKQNLTQWTIDEFVGLDVHSAKFNDPDNAGQQISVASYYQKKYNLNPMAGLPVVRMTKKIRGGPVYIPMDYLRIDENQRYNTKLSDTQTSSMMKFAVTLPKQRWATVEHGVKLLDWSNDQYLKHYGIKVNPAPTKVKARVLPSPQLGFGPMNKPAFVQERDLVAGRWRLDGKKFMGANTREIGAWGVCIIQGRFAVSKEAVQAFISNFIKIYEGHGGKFNTKWNKLPFLCPGNLADGGELIAKAYNQTGNHFNSRPMLMLFIVNDRNVEVYRRIKKSCDCRFGVPSQVMQSKHVQSNSPQYISNVCMKVNAKLGGCTSMVKSNIIPKIAPKSASIKTMIIGADVSHPAPGAGSDEKASFAALTMSCDTTFTRYWAQCQTNGNRIEMVTTQNIHDHLGDMAKMWMSKVGGGAMPERILYIRDGVSEGQYAAVINEEVRDMRECFAKIGAKNTPKFTVVIAGKRHHIRFFPEKGDKNGNPLPGTLVETGCTHPFEFDFYLCSHVAIKGTARPIHYHCILNECGYDAAELQSFLFEHSYQYVRSTTPVSLHPAAYYAHLAADRSRAHQNESPVSSGKKDQKGDAKSSTGSTGQSVEVRPLMALNPAMALKETMWFV